MKTSPLRFGTATSADVPELARLINSAYREPGPAVGWTDERDLLEGPRTDEAMLRDDLAANRVLIARRAADGPVLACLRISIDHDAAWYLSTIAVDPAQQTAGIGSALLAEAERQARISGAPCLRMTVIGQRESLIAWYERRGFRRTGATVPFPYDDPRVGRPLRQDLFLIVLEKPL